MSRFTGNYRNVNSRQGCRCGCVSRSALPTNKDDGPVLSKHVEVDTTEYKLSNGKEPNPNARGRWYFDFGDGECVLAPKLCIYFPSLDGGTNPTYRQARRWACKEAVRVGAFEVSVCC